MPRPSRKTGAAAVQENAMGIGHNNENDVFEKECVEFVAKKMTAISGIQGEIKEKLREAKEVGILKQAIRKAVKNLMMTDEQRQASQNVEAETMRITNMCRDLPLFSGALN